MLKRICAFCLIMVLTVALLTVVPVNAASDSDIQLVIDLGIISVSEDTGLIPKSINRADFARSLCLMERNENPPQVTAEEAIVYASDITTNSNCNFIVSVLSSGYMKKDSDSRFNPSTSISMEEAVPALVKMLGYEHMAQANGGTYESYYKIALKIGILKGVSVKDSKKLTAEETAKILTNTMSAKMFIPDNIINGEECLWDRWNITVNKGKILANSNMGILTNRTSPGFVNIDGAKYYTNLLIDNSIVGSNITYYTMYGEKGYEVVSISVNSYSDTITLKSNKIKSISDSGKLLKIKTEDKRTLEVDKKGFLIVNGKTYSPSKDIFDVFDSGTATFVDSDDNGVYDIVHMTLLFQTIVGGVNQETKTLKTRFDNQVISLEDIDVYDIYLGKKRATLSDLSEGMPIGIACDSFDISTGKLVLNFTNAEYIQIYASNRITTGRITALLSGGGFKLDDVSKSPGSGYTRLVAGGYIQPFKIGECITAYFDNLGELTYYEIAEGTGMHYGYLVKAGVTGILTYTTAVKILDTDGKFNIYEAGEYFILDGSRVESGSTIYSVNAKNDVDLSNRQIVRYREEDGVLKEIDTRIIRSGVEHKDNSLDESLPFDVTKQGNSKYIIRSGAIDRKVAFSSDCIMFIDEADINDENPPENRFSVSKANSLGKGRYYIAGYDANMDSEISCVIRYDGYGSSGGQETGRGLDYSVANCYIVEEIWDTYNDYGDPGWQLTLAGDSKKVIYTAFLDNLKLYTTKSAEDWDGESVIVYREDAANLTNIVKPGDIIRFQTNSTGNITYIEKMFDFESHMNTFAEVPVKDGQIYGFAKLEKISGNNIIYSYGNYDDRYISRCSNKFTLVPLYHISTGEIEMVSLSDIPSAATGNNVKCFLRYYAYGEVRDNIFYIYD